MGRRRWSTLHRNPRPPQLEYTSYHSWAALKIGRRYGTSFAASTFTGLSKCIQPAQAEDGMGPASSYTGSLVNLHQFSSTPYISLELSLYVRRKMGGARQVTQYILYTPVPRGTTGQCGCVSQISVVVLGVKPNSSRYLLHHFFTGSILITLSMV
jgi:hypothetical protein